MEIWLWAAIGVMATIIVVLFVKIYTLQKSAKARLTVLLP